MKKRLIVWLLLLSILLAGCNFGRTKNTLTLEQFIKNYTENIPGDVYPLLKKVNVRDTKSREFVEVTKQNKYTYEIVPSGLDMIVYADKRDCIDSVEFKVSELGLIALTNANADNFAVVLAYYAYVLTSINESITFEQAAEYMAELSKQTGSLRKLDVSTNTRVILHFSDAGHSLHIYVNGEYDAGSEEITTKEKVNTENLQDALQGYWAYENEWGSLDVVVFDGKEMNSWVYPGCGDRARTITQIEKNNDDFKITVHYSAEEYMGDFYPESYEIYYISSADNFNTSLTIGWADDQQHQYAFIGKTATEYEEYVAAYDDSRIADNAGQITYVEETPNHKHIFNRCTGKDSATHILSCECGVYEIEEHAFDSGKVTKEPTITSAGTKIYNCVKCSMAKTETIEKIEHFCSFGDWVETDSTTHTRSCVCGKKESEKHLFDTGVVTKEPTITYAGTKTYTCTICSTTKTESMDKLQHTCKFGGWVNNNSTTHTRACSCGKTESENHKFGDWQSEIETDLYIESGRRYCTKCLATEYKHIEKALQYSFELICDNCGYNNGTIQGELRKGESINDSFKCKRGGITNHYRIMAENSGIKISISDGLYGPPAPIP